MLQFEFNLITFLLGIVSGVISTLIGQWAYNKWLAKKPPDPIFALIPNEAGNIDFTGKVDPDLLEIMVSHAKGIFKYIKPHADASDTADVEQEN